MTEARIERVADALELIVQARLKRVPTQSELRDEAKKLLTGYLASRAARAFREDQFKAPYAADLRPLRSAECGLTGQDDAGRLGT